MTGNLPLLSLACLIFLLTDCARLRAPLCLEGEHYLAAGAVKHCSDPSILLLCLLARFRALLKGLAARRA